MAWKSPEKNKCTYILQLCASRKRKDGKISSFYQLGNLLCSLPHLKLITLIIVQDIFIKGLFDAKEHVSRMRATGNIKLIPIIREVIDHAH